MSDPRQRFVCLTVIILVSAGCFSAFITHNGQYAISGRGVDWAHHLSLIEMLLRDGNRDVAIATRNLGEMAFYPPLSHWMGVIISRIFNLSPPQTIQLLSTFFACMGAFLLGIRYVRLLEQQRCPPIIQRMLWGLLSVLLFGLTLLGFGVFGHITYNFFYPQLIATVLAMWSIEFLKRWQKRSILSRLIAVHLLGVTITSIHLLAGMWFYLAAFIISMPISLGIKKIVVYVIVFGGTSLVAFGLNPSVFAMLKIARNDGVFVSRGGVVSSSPLLFLLYGTALIISSLFIIAYYKNWLPNPSDFLYEHAEFFSITALAVTNSFVFLFFDLGSWYSVKKYLLIFSCEAPIVLITLSRLLFRNYCNFTTNVVSRKVRGSLIFLLVVIQIPWGRWVHNDADVIFYRNELLQPHRISNTNDGRLYPQFSNLLCQENYYLAISILAIPRDSRTMQWLNNRCVGEKGIEL